MTATIGYIRGGRSCARESLLDIRDSTAREILDHLAARGLRARVRTHKRFLMDAISSAARDRLDIACWLDKRHTLADIERS